MQRWDLSFELIDLPLKGCSKNYSDLHLLVIGLTIMSLPAILVLCF